MALPPLRTAAFAGLVTFALIASTAGAGTDVVVSRSAQLPDLGLSEVQDAVLPGSLADDRGVDLGGIGSGLFAIGADEFWTVTDRGPNGEVEVGEETRRTFIVPDFTPSLVRVAVVGDAIEVREVIPITTPAGDPVTGLSNLEDRDEVPYGADAATLLTTNPNGLDTEGVVRTADGHFWLVDEYGPSIVELDAAGHVLVRYVPSGLEDDYLHAGVTYPVEGALPSALADRRANRGFEDIALLPDGVTVVVALQSALVVEGDRDRILTELLTFDTASRTTLAELPYQFDDPATFTATEDALGRDLKISALVPLTQDRVLVQERTDAESRYYEVDLDPSDPLIAAEDKTLYVDLAGVEGVPGKIEGAALAGPDRLVLITDNDFGFVGDRAYAEGEDVEDSGAETVLVEVDVQRR